MNLRKKIFGFLNFRSKDGRNIFFGWYTVFTSSLMGLWASGTWFYGFGAYFKPLSEEIGVLARAFGFGETMTVYEVHCPMAFENRGGTWYQDNDDVRNPYFGATMLKCADRVEQIAHNLPIESPHPDPQHPDSPENDSSEHDSHDH